MSAGKHLAKLGRPCTTPKSSFRLEDRANAQLVLDQVRPVLKTLPTPNDVLPVAAARNAARFPIVEILHLLIQGLSGIIEQGSAPVSVQLQKPLARGKALRDPSCGHFGFASQLDSGKTDVEGHVR